jgi:hypothetical protein
MAAEVDRDRNRRLFGGFLGWLVYDGRRPVMFGAAVPFAGRTGVGKRRCCGERTPSWQ